MRRWFLWWLEGGVWCHAVLADLAVVYQLEAILRSNGYQTQVRSGSTAA